MRSLGEIFHLRYMKCFCTTINLSAGAIIHIRPIKKIRKGQNLMDTMLPDDFPVPQRGGRKVRPENPMSVFWGREAV